MKKLLLISLICILVFGLAITAMAKVNLVFWTYPYYVDLEKESGWFESRVISEFQEIYPEVNIDLQVLTTEQASNKIMMSVATGTPPDILHHCNMFIMPLAAAGVLSDFGDTMDAEERADFFPSLLKLATLDDKVYIYITSSGGGGMTINKKVAVRAGAMDLLPLDREDRNWTTEEFKAYLIKVAEANLPDTFGFAMHFGDSICVQRYIIHMIQSFGGELFVIEDGKYKCIINSPEAVEGLGWYLDLYDIPGVMLPGPETLTIQYCPHYWGTGKLGAFFGFSVDAQVLGEIEDPKATTESLHVAIPNPKGEKGLAAGELTGLGVFKSNPEKEKYAKLFCEFLATRPYLWEIGLHCPPREGSFDSDSSLYQTPPYPKGHSEIDFSLEWGKHFTAIDMGSGSPVYRQFLNIFAATMQGICIEELTIEEGLAEVEEKVNKLLDEYYKENPVE